MKYRSYQNKNKSPTRGAQLVPIGIPTYLQFVYIIRAKSYKYIVRKIMESITHFLT